LEIQQPAWAGIIYQRCDSSSHSPLSRLEKLSGLSLSYSHKQVKEEGPNVYPSRSTGNAFGAYLPLASRMFAGKSVEARWWRGGRFPVSVKIISLGCGCPEFLTFICFPSLSHPHSAEFKQ
jgi:hypothetical protein